MSVSGPSALSLYVRHKAAAGGRRGMPLTGIGVHQVIAPRSSVPGGRVVALAPAPDCAISAVAGWTGEAGRDLMVLNGWSCPQMLCGDGERPVVPVPA